jgi:hypothetical protein
VVVLALDQTPRTSVDQAVRVVDHWDQQPIRLQVERELLVHLFRVITVATTTLHVEQNDQREAAVAHLLPEEMHRVPMINRAQVVQVALFPLLVQVSCMAAAAVVAA